MDQVIKIPNHYSFMDHEVYDFDRALSIYDWNIKSSEVAIDMSQCLTANYQALSLVVLYLWHLRANNCHITVRFRDDKKGASQMWRWMGATGWSQVLNSEQQNFRSTDMKPLIALRNKPDFEVALAKLDAYTKGFNVEYEKTLRYVLSELMYNTLEHGKKFAKLSHQDKRIPSIIEFTWYKLRNELHFVVADIGMGIKKHLEQSFGPFETDEEAIRMALRPQVSGTFAVKDPYLNKDNAGVGLFISSNIIKRLNADMHIVSGHGVVHVSPVDVTGQTLNYFWPGTFVLIKVKLEQEMNLNLHSIMAELREVADEEISRAETAESSNRQLVVVENYFGKHAEDKEAAIAHRNRYLLPAISEGRSILIDFNNVVNAPHSFLSALLATPIKRLGMEAYKRIKIVNASPEIRETIDFILDENTSDN
ncbi:MAG: hypothetical protein Nkreftii_004137 [Candidatus Nitrospira kreftii]|uniref:DUF4325 domain-containing protein n=1 Tax=Candidatus Nitrospira kreftii TaxID=2652173 RepID=A0A7S8J229_9BACT|nr:MAG: hypothetical protein Nkreftii_004137 [Candidatus Nitrospira kreftii]